MTPNPTLPAIIRRASTVAGKVVQIEIAHPTGDALPQWAAGAHIDVYLPSGLIRQYSLYGDPVEAGYRIAVLREEDGRGGSVELCDLAAEGVAVTISAPRNHFPLKPADHYLFVAGGIGITPLLAMIRQVAAAGTPWTLVYRGASRAQMAFLDELSALPNGTVEVMPSDEVGRPDLDALIAATDGDTLIYCCGPNSMLDAISDAAERAGCPQRLMIERFGASGEVIDTSGDQPFEVELAQSGVTLTVPADRTLRDVLLERDLGPTFSCEEGYCGTCETRVIEGIPDHRDSVLSDEDKASNEYMMVCVSRAKTPRLVLDL